MVHKTGVKEALVWLGYFPGQRKPDFLGAHIDGETWSEEKTHQAIHVPNLSIQGAFHQLDLAEVRWSDVIHKGYFGNGWAWER